MLNAVIRFALYYRPLIVFLSLALLLYGGYSAARLPIDVFPDLDRPRVVVLTECLGLAPEEVEALVTAPLETGLLGATGVQTVRSQSGPGLSVINVEFDWGTNIYTARQVVQERLTAAQGALPDGLRPSMGPISSIMGQIMLLGIARTTGPHGGLLFSIQRSPYVVEFAVAADKSEATVAFWDPRDAQGKRRASTGDWRPVVPDDTALSLTWPGMAEALVLAPDARQMGVFRGHDPRLTDYPDDVRLAVTFQGRPSEVALSRAKQGMDIRTLADWIVRPRLLKVPGIAQISVMGGGRRQYQVLVDPAAMFQYGVTLEEIAAALRKNNLNATGGFADRGGMETPIRVFGRLGPDPERAHAELRRIPVKQAPQRTILLEQVARIVEGPQVKVGDASVNGQPGVMMTVLKQPHTDTRVVTSRILEAIQEIVPTLPAGVEIHSDLFQMKGFIDRGVTNVAEALAIGALLVLIVLFLFLLNVRTTLISLSAIPLSLAITAVVFKMIGWLSGTVLSINIMTLGGIAVAMGELVDDAIVDVENIFRRLRENYAAAAPRPALAVIYEASVEIRSAIVYGTVMVILVFLPLFALPGMEGRLFAPLALAYIVSVFASLLVSLTVTPALAYYVLPQARATLRTGDSPLLRGLKGGAARLIRFSMAYPGWILLGSWLLVAGAAWHMSRLDWGFLPSFDEGSVQVNLDLPAGSSLQASNRMCAVVDGWLARMRKSPANPDGLILSFVRKSGRAELDEHVDPVSGTEYVLKINPESGLSREETLALILKELKGDPKANVLGIVPYANVEDDQPLAHLINHMLTGVTAQLAIKIYGDDLDVLRRLAETIEHSLDRVEGITPPVIEAEQSIQELHIRLKGEALARHGIDREHAARYVQLALQGEVVSQVLEGQRRIDLVVRLDEPYRTNYADLPRLRIDVPNKEASVLLGDIAEVGPGYNPNYIKRENARRRLVVRCNAVGRDLGTVAADIDRRLKADLTLPAGYFVELGGQFQSQREATWTIALLGLASAAGMFMILYMLYPSTRIVLQVLNALPTAFIGGVLALVLTRQSVTVAALVGFISLGGIAVRNGILLVTHYFHLMRHEGEQFTPAMILRGSLERLAPVLMTALTAGIALIPLVLGGHQPGREILYPVATVILGGLVTSTLCEFLLHPGLFLRFSGRDVERLTGI